MIFAFPTFSLSLCPSRSVRHGALTLYTELDGVADVLALAVGHPTHVVAGPVAGQTLQHQRHVAHDDAVPRVLL